MRNVDKNDVSLENLFRWNTKITMKDPFTLDEIDIYIRIVGDAELNQARAHGFRKASKLREALRDEESEESETYLLSLSETESMEDYFAVLRFLLMNEYGQKAVSEVHLPEPREPKSTAPQKAFEKYQKEIDEYPDKFKNLVFERTNELIDKEINRLRKLEKEEVYKYYKNKVIERLCTEELNKAFYDKCIYFSAYVDPEFKQRAFSSFDAFENAASPVKQMLTDAYRNLELGLDVLKASQGVTE